MVRQRWGTFSVKDHTRDYPFAADVLMYDKLVIPRPATGLKAADWDAQGWAPAHLDEVLEILGEDNHNGKAVVVDWTDDSTKAVLDSHLASAEQIRHEACKFDITRRFLKQKTIDGLSEDSRIEVVAAYGSAESAESDWGENDTQNHLGLLTAGLCHQLLVPDPAGRSWQKVLQEAIELSNDREFKLKRNRLYDWQRQLLSQGVEPQQAVEAMSDYVDEYNAAVKRNVGKVYTKFAFTLFPIVAAAGMGGFGVAAAAMGAASLLQFYLFDRHPVVPVEVNQAAAMFHMAQKTLNWRAAQ